MSVDAIYKLTLAARIFKTALRFPQDPPKTHRFRKRGQSTYMSTEA